MRIFLEPDLDHPTFGLWCEECEQPSAVSFPFFNLSLDGVTNAGTFVTCPDCGMDGGEIVD